MTVFAEAYARSYDEFYAEKDYERECDYVEQALRRFALSPTKRILDLGCGTGSHAIRLARRGYEVTGVDRSAPMLEIARSKVAGSGLPITWERGDIRSFKLPGSFDAAVSMFAVFGYLVETADLLLALRNAREHLRQGGLLIFDAWYGPAVLALRPLERSRVMQSGARTTIRVSQPTLYADRDVVDVRIRVWQLDGSRLESASDETHSVRYFFQPELRSCLERSGFDVASFNAFPELGRNLDESTWNLGCVAIAR